MSAPELFNIVRFPSHEVKIGDCPLGGQHPIRLQSMTNTNTLEVSATVAQSIRIFKAGADYVRISAPSTEAAHKLKAIKHELVQAGFRQPLVADIHFNADVALIAARYVEKVRINPGNYIKGVSRTKTHFTEAETRAELDQALERLKPLVHICKQQGTAIRIGTNLGSLSPRIVTQYGNTPEGMVMATFEFLEIFEALNFDNLVVSLKASKPVTMIQAYEGMVEKMLENNMSYPLHIGITEAGEGENGRIKSALGMCTLLNKGIGDTLRVSLTEDPELEIPFANKISSVYQVAFTSPQNAKAFQLKKYAPAKSDIFLFDDNRKAFITATYPNPDPLTEVRSNNETTLAGEKLTADLFFTHNKEVVEKNPEKLFIIPSEVWAQTQPVNAYPIQECNAEKENKKSAHYFLRICCNEKTQKFIPANSSKPRAIIADLGKCDFSGSLQQLVELGQQQAIPVMVKKEFQTGELDDLISHIAIIWGGLLLERKIQGLWIEAPRLKEDITTLAFGFLQSAGLRITRTEFISCPTCARTTFNLQQVLHQIQEKIAHIPGLKIAVMGCVVNGPGEMADADFGFVGTGTGKLHLYKGKSPIIKNIEPAQAVDHLLEVLKAHGYIV